MFNFLSQAEDSPAATSSTDPSTDPSSMEMFMSCLQSLMTMPIQLPSLTKEEMLSLSSVSINPVASSDATDLKNKSEFVSKRLSNGLKILVPRQVAHVEVTELLGSEPPKKKRPYNRTGRHVGRNGNKRNFGPSTRMYYQQAAAEKELNKEEEEESCERKLVRKRKRDVCK